MVKKKFFRESKKNSHHKNAADVLKTQLCCPTLGFFLENKEMKKEQEKTLIVNDVDYVQDDDHPDDKITSYQASSPP